MSHNRDLSAAAGQFGFHSSNIGIGSEAPRYALDVYNSNLLVSGPSAGNIILEDRGVADGSRPFHVVSSDGGKFVINRSNRSASGTTTSSVNSLTLSSSGNLGLGVQTSPASNIHIGDISNGYELKISGNALQFNRSSNSYIDQLHDTGSILFRMTSSNTEAMRITSAGRIGINQTSPDAMLQVDYDEGSSEVGLRLRAYNASGSKTWQLSEVNGNAGVFTIRNATNSQNNLSIDGSSGYVGVNATSPDRRLEVVETASSLTYPVAVSNHTDASEGVGAGIAFHLTSGGNSRGELGLVYAGNSNSNGTDFVFKPNDGSTGNVERLRISSAGTIFANTARSSGTTSTTRTKQHAAMRLSLSRNGGSAPYYGWGPALDFYSDNYDGSTQRPNARIAGVISNSSVDHEGGQLRFYTTANDTATSETDFTERMRIYADGMVTKPYQPSFKCKLSTATGANFTGYLVFNSVSYNIGSHYNSSNGRFTAPIRGRYLFAWYTNMERAGGNGSLFADWYINASAQGNRMYTHHSGAWELIGGTIIFDLNANDYVQIHASTSGNWDGGSYGAFSGCLLG